MAKAGPSFQCVLLTPDDPLYDGEADFVALPAIDGDVGVLGAHAPLVTRLGVGPLRIHTAGAKRFFYISGGFAEVANDRLTVLAERAEVFEMVSVEDADKHLDDARAMKTESLDEHEEKNTALLKAHGIGRIARDAAQQ